MVIVFEQGPLNPTIQAVRVTSPSASDGNAPFENNYLKKSICN